MKTFSLLFALLILQSCGTVQNIKADDLSATKIYENLNKSQSDLYVISNSWMIDTFNNAESVIQFSDKETGSIIGKYLLWGSVIRSGYLTTDNRIFAKIDISLKDNRAKITIAPTADINIYSAGASVKFRDQINGIIESYTVAINKNNALNW